MTCPWALFTVSGSRRLGLGHVYRSITLARALKGLSPRFHAAEPEARRLLKSQGFSSGESLAALLRLGPAVIVFDRPMSQWRDLGAVRRLAPGMPVLALDYFREKPAPEEAVNLLDIPRGRWRTGLKYAILRPALRPARKAPAAVRRVLVTFGSSDPGKRTFAALKLLARSLPAGARVDVLTGPLFPWGKELKALRSPLEVRVHQATTKPEVLMRRADFAFSGGGTTSLELCRLGVPTAVLPQTAIERRFAASLPVLLEPTPAALRRALSPSALARRSHAGRRAVDGLGARRVAKLVEGLAR